MTIKISGVEVDLNKIGIDFIPNEEQMAALEHLASFMKSDKDIITCVLSGSAGTGKTSLVKIFLEYVRLTHRSQIKLVAPTHKAKAVLSRLSSNTTATTLHKVLGLKPNFNILEFDAKNMKFLDSLDFTLFDTIKELIIVDECSMINNDLYDLLVKKANKKDKVLFLGDIKQIAPVKQGSVSKVFTNTDYPGINLNKVERQRENPLINTLTKLRDNVAFDYETEVNQDKGIYVHDIDSFKVALSDSFFSLDVLNKAPQGVKILAYTNNRVQAFNRFARKLMAIGKEAVNKGEFLMAYDSYSRGFDQIIHNGTEYIVVSALYDFKDIPGFGNFEGYKLTLKEVHSEEILTIFLLDPEADDRKYEHLGIIVESLRIKAYEGNLRGKKKPYLWKPFYEINESFVCMRDIYFEGRVIRKKTLDYGYAMTIHKSQSSTYTNVFVDLDNVNLCKDENERKQLQYVALSRPTHCAHILKK